MKESELRTIEDHIDWVLAHPDMSSWLKSTLTGVSSSRPLDIIRAAARRMSLKAPLVV